MLAYLDALIDALTVRDPVAVDRLLAHPLARVLSEPAREEAVRLVGGSADPLAAPLRVMQLRHVTAELLRGAPEVPAVADQAEAVEATPADAPRDPRRPTVARRAGRLVQMELPLSA